MTVNLVTLARDSDEALKVAQGLLNDGAEEEARPYLLYVVACEARLAREKSRQMVSSMEELTAAMGQLRRRLPG